MPYLKPKIALIGVNGIGVQHRKCLAQLHAEEMVDWSAVADPALANDPVLSEELLQRGVRIHPNLNALLTDESDLQALVIATPVPLHEDMVKSALSRGLDVLLEKPPVPLLSQLDNLLILPGADRVAVAFQMICSREIRRLKNWIEDGQLGTLREIRLAAGWPRPTSYYQRAAWAGQMLLNNTPVFDGPLCNALAHLTQNALFLAGPATGFCAEPTKVIGEFYRARPITGHDTVAVRSRLPDGTLVSAAFSHATHTYRPFTIEVVGSQDVALISSDGQQLQSGKRGIVNDWKADDEPQAFLALYRDFATFVQGKQASPCTPLRNTRGFLLTTNAALLSSGGIREIPSSETCIHGEGDAANYEVKGLHDLIERSARDGSLFSETETSWALPGVPVSTANLPTLDLALLTNHGSIAGT